MWQLPEGWGDVLWFHLWCRGSQQQVQCLQHVCDAMPIWLPCRDCVPAATRSGLLPCLRYTNTSMHHAQGLYLVQGGCVVLHLLNIYVL
jgi:hypothetical protein